MVKQYDEEQQLVKALSKGDKRAFQGLYASYAGLFLTITRRYARSSQEAEDLLQESFVQIYRKVSSFKGQGSFEGWMKRIVVNKCLTALRKKELFSDLSTEELGEQAGQEAIGLSRLHVEEILAAFEQLPIGARTVLNLYAIDGYDHGEIAQELGISESASRSQLTKARARLRVILEERELMEP